VANESASAELFELKFNMPCKPKMDYSSLTGIGLRNQIKARGLKCKTWDTDKMRALLEQDDASKALTENIHEIEDPQVSN